MQPILPYAVVDPRLPMQMQSKDGKRSEASYSIRQSNHPACGIRSQLLSPCPCLSSVESRTQEKFDLASVMRTASTRY